MKKIDLGEKKTEAEWQKVIDNFWMKVTPQWFELLEWIIIIGAFTFLAKQTQNITLNIVSNVSYIVLFFYLQSILFSLEIYGIPMIKSEQYRRIVSLIISALLSFGIWLLLTNLVSDIQGKI